MKTTVLTQPGKVSVKRSVYGGGNNWVAEITGRDIKYGFERNFLPSQDVTSSNSNVYRDLQWTLPDGVYEFHFATSSSGTEQGFWMVEGGELTEIAQEEVLVARERLRRNAASLAYQKAIEQATPCDVSATGNPADSAPDDTETRKRIPGGTSVSGTLTLYTECGSVHICPICFVIENQRVRISQAYMTGVHKDGSVFGNLRYYGADSIERLIRSNLRAETDPHGNPIQVFAYRLSAYSHDPALNYRVRDDELETIRAAFPQVEGKGA